MSSFTASSRAPRSGNRRPSRSPSAMAPPIQTGRRRSTTERRCMTRGAAGCATGMAVIGSTPQPPQPAVSRSYRGRATYRQSSTLALRRRLPVRRALSSREERLPRDSRGVQHPCLLGLRVAAGGRTLVEEGPARGLESVNHLAQLRSLLDLDPEMVNSGRATPCGDGEVDAWIVEHPLRVIRLAHRGRCREKRRVELHGLLDVFNGDVYVQTLHASLLRPVRGLRTRERSPRPRSSSRSGTPPGRSSGRSWPSR